MGPFGVVELQGAGDRVEDGGGDAGDRAAFELGVVLDADPGEGGDLAAAQPGHPAGADVGQARLLRGDLGSPRDQELADLGTVVHAVDATADPASAGMPYQYTVSTETPPTAAGRVGWRHRATAPESSGSVDYPSDARRFHRCVVLSCTPPATSGSRTGPTRRILKPTDAIIRLSATCICGSDLWPYRGVDEVDGPSPMGHEYAGIVEEVGAEVTTIKPGQFVVGSFFASDNTCEICRAGYQTSCVNREGSASDGAQAERMRVPLADGTLVATPEIPDRRPDPGLPGRSPTCSAPAGSAPSPPRPARARRSPWSVTARSGCSGCWPRSSSARNGSSR